MLKPFSRATNRVFPCREKLKFNIYRRGNLTTEFSVSLTLQINNQILQRLLVFFFDYLLFFDPRATSNKNKGKAIWRLIRCGSFIKR